MNLFRPDREAQLLDLFDRLFKPWSWRTSLIIGVAVFIGLFVVYYF